MNRSVIYTATGDQYIDELETSITSLRSHMPDISITVVTDTEYKNSEVTNIITLSDPRYDYGDSIINMDWITAERVLYLDTDTHITGDLSELFEALDEFDIGATHTPGKRSYSSDQVPTSFPLYNTGVIIFRNNAVVEKLFDSWRKNYLRTLDNNTESYNQPAFRKALYQSNARVLTLPREYNCFIIRPGQLCSDVKIFHGRHPDLNDIIQSINEEPVRRCYVPQSSTYPIDVYYPGNIKGHKPSFNYKIRENISRFKKSVKERGFVSTIFKLVD